MAKRQRFTAEFRQRIRDQLPAGVTLDDVSELCQAVAPGESGFGCGGGTHSVALATRRLTLGEFPAVASEVLVWLADLGGVCDCTIRTTAFERVVELSADVW